MESLIIRENMEIEKIVLSFHGITMQERPEEIELTPQQTENFIRYLSGHYVRRSLFKKQYTDNKDFIGCDVFVTYKQENANGSDMVCFFTNNIISINDVQYKTYAGSLYDEIQSLLNGFNR